MTDKEKLAALADLLIYEFKLREDPLAWALTIMDGGIEGKKVDYFRELQDDRARDLMEKITKIISSGHNSRL